ncbi:MAG: YggS family pyridoxal phosphate-dependent enzyme [Pseudobdellovibrionaceae bacterium]
MSFQDNLKEIRKTIERVGKHRDVDVSTIRVVAVSKQQPEERILEALESGYRLFAENRVNDAAKIWGGEQGLKARYDGVELHLIGHLQTNKVKEAVALFDMIETLDSVHLAEELAKEMEKQVRRVPLLIQVNTGEEPQKSGIAPKDLDAFVATCRKLDLPVQGLMCLPPEDEPAGLHFTFLKELSERVNLPKLSMGMSGDFEKAVPFKPDYVRIGSALFGARKV